MGHGGHRGTEKHPFKLCVCFCFLHCFNIIVVVINDYIEMNIFILKSYGKKTFVNFRRNLLFLAKK